MVVAAGLVTGVTAAMMPNGSAMEMMPSCSPMMPTDGLPLM